MNLSTCSTAGPVATTGLLRIAASNTYPQGSEYGGLVEGSTYQLVPTLVAYNQVDLSFVNGPGLSYDELKVERNGTVVATLSGSATSFSDTTVQPYTQYTYQVRGYVNGLGETVYSQKLDVETPASPGAFQAIGNARDSDTIDISLVDTLHTSAIAHRIYRDGMVIATTTGDKFADFFLVPSTTYTYQLEAITASGISLGFSSTIQVTTEAPDGTEETQPTQGAPQNPNVPLRLVEDVTVTDPVSPVPHVINTCSRISFVLENVDTSSVFIDRVEAEATIVLDGGYGTTTRDYSPDAYQYPTPPLEILPGERYEYEGDNCDGDEWPGITGTATVVPMVKLYTVGGLIQITDIDPSAGYASFPILPSYTNPDFRVVDIRLTPSEPQDGDSISIDLDIKNDGDAAAGTFITEVTLPNGTTANTTSDQLAVGETKTTTIPIGTFAASFNEVDYKLDKDDAHYEWDETNNQGTFYFSVVNPLPPATGYYTEIWDTTGTGSSPELPTGPPDLIRTDPAINFDWGSGSPDPSIPAGHYIVRWNGNFDFPGGNCTFTVNGNDGTRFYLDFVYIPELDHWFDQNGSATYQHTMNVPAGTHNVKLEYYQNNGTAKVNLSWTCDDPHSGGYYTEIWDIIGTSYSPNLPSGPPDLIRTDPAINFDWGSGSPDPSIPVDHFLIRWNQDIYFAEGYYTFTISGDDGTRFYLDFVYIPELDHWFDQDGSQVYQHTMYVPEGTHNVKLEYYEHGGGAKVNLNWDGPN